MKANYNGIELEGTAEELAAVLLAMAKTGTKPAKDKAVKREAFLAEAVDLSEDEKSKAYAVFSGRSAPKGMNPFAFQKAAKSGKATPAVKAYLQTL